MSSNRTRRLNVLVAHAEPLIAMGLATALRQQPDIDVSLEGEALSLDRGGDAIDVVISDYQGGLRLVAEMSGHASRHALAGARVLVVAMSDQEHKVRTAIEGGVYGYLLVRGPIEELARGVHAVARGSHYLCIEASQRMAESMTRQTLTLREGDVLHLLARGQCNKSIARELEVSVATVKAHVRSVMAKLDASSRTQAAGIAAQRGLVDGASPGAATSRAAASRSPLARGAGTGTGQFA